LNKVAMQPPVDPIDYADVPERNTGDNVLRTAQQHHVQMSMMADTKANIIITVSSIVLTMALGRARDHLHGPSAIVLAVFTMLALILAILAVLPKFKSGKPSTGDLPDDFNILFFGHFAQLSRERFLQEVAKRMAADGSAYRLMANDLYSLGSYLAHHKYPYLRWAYVFLLCGFVIAAMTEGWMVLRH
jgi:F0F1-type ATP synthase assembly protein I